MRMPISGTKDKNHIWVKIGAIIAAYLICMPTLFNISGISLAKFFLLNLVSVFLPGLAIFVLIHIKLSRVGTFCTSYLMGYAFLVVEYFFSEIFDRKLSFTAVTVLVAIVSIFFIGKKMKGEKPFLEIKETDNEKIEIFFWVIFIILSIFAYAAKRLGTDVAPIYGEYFEIPFWMNNTVALKLSWPADNLFMAGKSLNYHYFSSIPIAFLCEVYKIDIFTMSIPLYCLTKAIVVVGAAQFLLDAITTDIRLNLLGYILMIFSAGAETISVVPFVDNILISPFGFDIGYAYGMFFVGFLIRQWKMDQYEGKFFIGVLLAWSMCVGAKAPIASVLLPFAGLLCFYWLIHKKWILSLGYGLSILGIFLLICKFCVGMFSVMNGDALWMIVPYGTDHFTFMGIAESWDLIGRCMIIKGSENPFLGLLFRTICLNPLLIFGMIAAVVWVIYLEYKKKIDTKDIYFQVSLTITTGGGIYLWHRINAGGASEAYFSMAALIPMSVMIIFAMELYLRQHERFKYAELPAIKKSVLVVFVLLLQLGVYRFSWSAFGGGALGNANTGFWNLYDVRQGHDYLELLESGIRNTDVEALSWIRDNAEPDAIIMTDKAVMTDNNAYYLYGIFCERQQYLEGSNMLDTQHSDTSKEIARRKTIITRAYHNDVDSLKTARKDGVDYVVQTLDITPDFVYNSDYLELVASSETMNIYKVK